MKSIKLGHLLSFYMHRKKISWTEFKKILDISKAIRVFVFPLLCIWQFECSVHIFRGPWYVKLYWNLAPFLISKYSFLSTSLQVISLKPITKSTYNLQSVDNETCVWRDLETEFNEMTCTPPFISPIHTSWLRYTKVSKYECTALCTRAFPLTTSLQNQPKNDSPNLHWMTCALFSLERTTRLSRYQLFLHFRSTSWHTCLFVYFTSSWSTLYKA
jgi:hypothetical protein